MEKFSKKNEFDNNGRLNKEGSRKENNIDEKSCPLCSDKGKLKIDKHTMKSDTDPTNNQKKGYKKNFHISNIPEIVDGLNDKFILIVTQVIDVKEGHSKMSLFLMLTIIIAYSNFIGTFITFYIGTQFYADQDFFKLIVQNYVVLVIIIVFLHACFRFSIRSIISPCRQKSIRDKGRYKSKIKSLFYYEDRLAYMFFSVIPLNLENDLIMKKYRIIDILININIKTKRAFLVATLLFMFSILQSLFKYFLLKEEFVLYLGAVPFIIMTLFTYIAISRIASYKTKVYVKEYKKEKNC